MSEERGAAEGGGEVVLAAQGLTKEFRTRTRRHHGAPPTRAVIDVSLEVRHGRTLGIAGESGSGKTTLARMLLALEQPTAGQVIYQGQPIDARTRAAERFRYRRAVQAVFQDVGGSLDPRMPVSALIMEPLRFLDRDRYPRRADRLARAREVLEMVRLDTSTLDKYPRQLSGGQRQRVAIARALSTSPEVIIMDEPISALDTSIRNQILNLLTELQRSSGVAYVIIAHDLAMLSHVADEVAVMYLGQLFETGPTRLVLGWPAHPYTQALLAAVPTLDSGRKVQPAMRGEISDEIPTGCHFHSRCPLAGPVCATEAPPVHRAGAHLSACHVLAPPVEPHPPTRSVLTPGDDIVGL